MTTELKVCNKCHLELPLSSFTITNKAKGWLLGSCMPCAAARVRAYYAANADYRARAKANSIKQAKANPKKTAIWQRKVMLKSKYGLTPDQFDRLLAAQSGKCALCGAAEHGRRPKDVPQDGSRKWLLDSWPVDHCHKDGRVRGLLCHPCNAQLGGYEALLDRVGEDAVREYLTQPSPILALPIAEPPVDIRATARFVAELPPRYTRGQCSIDGCGVDQHAGSLCFKHYMRARRRGDTALAGPVRGEGHHKSALTESQAREIKFGAEKGAALARRFNVTPAVISSIRHGHTWKHLQPETLQ